MAVGQGSGEISYSVKEGDAATVDSEGELTIIKAGAITITAEIAQCDKFLPAQAEYSLIILRTEQTVGFIKGAFNDVLGRTEDTVVYAPDYQIIKRCYSEQGFSPALSVTYEINDPDGCVKDFASPRVLSSLLKQGW
jgi:hypothetical protein